MIQESIPITEWFGLARPNFILDPAADADFFAPRSHVNVAALAEDLQVNLVTQIPPKKLFWGLYGGGKTHTLFAVANKLKGMVPVHIVYVECPNVAKKSTFLDLYKDGIMASMGRRFVVSTIKEVVHKCYKDVAEARGSGGGYRDALIQKLGEVLESEELARAAASLMADRPEHEDHFWRYMAGVPVSSRDLSELGLAEDLTAAQPGKLAQIVAVIGKVLRILNTETLTLILDELDRLYYVGEETGSTFGDAFRKLFSSEQRSVALLMGCSADSLKSLPEVFGGERGPVLSRLSPNDRIEITQLDPIDVDEFIAQVIAHIRDSSANMASLITKAASATSERVTERFFPFTDDAKDALVGALKQKMTPREITQRMTHAAGKAYLNRSPAILKDHVA